MPRYNFLTRACAARGLVFVAWDCPYHGTSSRLGSERHGLRPLRVKKASEIVNYGIEFVRAARAAYPGLTTALVGESMGGAIAMHVAEKLAVPPSCICSLAGLVPTSAHTTLPLPALWVHACVSLARVASAAPRAARLEAKNDPLVKIAPPSLGAVRCLRELARDLDVKVPLLMTVGTRDRLFSVRATLRAFAKCRAPPLRSHLYIVDGARHDSLIEDVRAVEVCADFCARECSD